MTQEPEIIDVKPEEKKPRAEAPVIALDENRLPAPADNRELRGLIATLAKGGAFPSAFDNEPKQIAAYNMARALCGDQWQLALNHMAFVENKLCIYGELPGKLAENTKEVAEKSVKLFTKDYVEICLANKNLDAEPWAAVCKIQRKGREPKEFHFTQEHAKKMNKLPAKPGSGWSKDLGTMLRRRAMAQAIKFEFPDAILGAPIAEYDFGEAPDIGDIKDVTPKGKISKSLMDELDNEAS